MTRNSFITVSGCPKVSLPRGVSLHFANRVNSGSCPFQRRPKRRGELHCVCTHCISHGNMAPFSGAKLLSFHRCQNKGTQQNIGVLVFEVAPISKENSQLKPISLRGCIQKPPSSTRTSPSSVIVQLVQLYPSRSLCHR